MNTLAPSASTSRADRLPSLLTRLTVAFARRRSYPESHPLVMAAEEQAFETLRAVLADRSRFVLSIGQQELLIDGVAEPLGGSVARELADRLRLRGVGAIGFDVSVSSASLRQAIAWLAYDPSAPANQHQTDAPAPTLSGISINRIAYDRLTLGNGDDDAGASSAAIWRALASTAFAALDALGDEPIATADSPVGADGVDASLSEMAPQEVAGAIERRLSHTGYAQRVAFVLLRVADQVAHAREDQRAELGERLRAVLTSLRGDSVSIIIKSVGVGADQRRFISQMIDALPADAVIEWMETAARATEHDLSHHMLRLLTKLSSRAQDAPAAATAQSFRGVASALVHGWKLDDAQSASHLRLLDYVQHDEADTARAHRLDTDAERIVQMALEVNVFGEDAGDAVQTLIEHDRIADLLTWSAEAPGRDAAKTLRRTLVKPEVIKEVLLREPPDIAAARTILSTVDLEAADILLDVLCDASSRTMRRMVIDRLREFGAPMVPLCVARLDGAPWYFVRNLLALLRDLSSESADIGAVSRTTASVGGSAASHQLMSFLGHAQEQVRLEALRLLITDPLTRNAALIISLDDASVRVLRMALETIGATEADAHTVMAMSPELTRRILRFIEDDTHANDITARAIRALVNAPRSSQLRDQLMQWCTKRTLVLRRVTLADPTPVMLAALDVLSARFAQDSAVTPIIERAMESTDRRIVDAVRKSGRVVVSAA